MHVLSAARARRFVRVWALGAVLAGSVRCATGPRIEFAGTWTSQLPQASSVLFYATQTGSTISGTVSNVGPVVIGRTYPITGSVTRQGLTVEFDYPGIVSGTIQGPPTAWTFHGAFTSATTVEGTITSASGITGHITITKNNGPLPV
jgi:hypothetical protein